MLCIIMTVNFHSFADKSNGTGHIYSMTFPTSTGVASIYDGVSITVVSQGCVNGEISPAVSLSVRCKLVK